MHSFFRSKLAIVLSFLFIIVIGFTLLDSTGLVAHATAPILKRATVHGGPTVDPCNANVAIQVGMTPGSDFGRFNQGAYPNPATCGAGPNSFNLSYDWPNAPGTSFTTMRVDGQDYVYGTDGSSIQTPTEVNGTTNVSQWQLTPNIKATQTLQITTGPTTGKLDTALIGYDITNTDTVSHSIGIRAMIDTMLNNNDGAPFFVPGAGAVTTESDFTGAAVPQRWQAFYSLTSSPQFSAEGTLIGLPAVTPDRFVIASWRNIDQTKFDYTTTPGPDVTADSAVAAYWTPKALAPGGTLHVATLYGLSGFTSDLTPPLALSLTAPSSLTVNGNGNLTPNPFTISGFIENVGSATATGATATLTLPSGLALAAGETATHALGDLLPNQTTTFTSWQVIASTAGTLTFSVTATDTNTPPTPKTVSRSIIVPTEIAGTEFTCPATAPMLSAPTTSSPVQPLGVYTPQTASSAISGRSFSPLHTSGNQMLDASGNPVKLASVNWYGAESPDFVPMGLDKQPMDAISANIASMGFNAVRLPWSNELVECNPNVSPSLVTMNQQFANQPAMAVFDAVVNSLATHGLMVILDNHMTDAAWCCSTSDSNDLWWSSKGNRSD